MKILVTGAGGFVGRSIVTRLACNHDVWALYHKQSGPQLSGVSWLQHDLSLGMLPAGLPKRMDVVIHLAQSPHYREFPERADDIYAIGTGATMLLLDWARRSGASQFILASTGGLYGWSDDPVKETDAVIDDHGPLGFYFAVKRACELFVAQYSSSFSTVILRFFFVYGAGQSNNMLLPKLVATVRDGRPIILQGEEGMRLNPIHISDAVTAMERCLELTDSHVLNIAGPTPVCLRRVGELIGRHVGHLPVFTVDSSTTPRHLVADIGRMSTVIGSPLVEPTQGIAELCRAAQEKLGRLE